jgi:general stress protein 26
MSSNNKRTDAEDVARVWRLIEKIDICMFASRDGDAIRARPMSSIPREAQSVVYFLTDTEGHKESEIAANNNVSLLYAEPSHGKFLTVTGRARVLNDRALIAELWNKDAEAFWNGADDPRVRVVEVTPIDAQFWEGPHGIVATVEMAIAAVTAQPPVLGEQRKVDLQ